MDMPAFLGTQLDLVKMRALEPAPLTEAGSISTRLDRRVPEELHKAAQEFESYFLSYLLNTMRETVPHGLLDRKGEEVWYSFYDQEIARLATQAGGIGITSFIDAYTDHSGLPRDNAKVPESFGR